MDFPMNNSPLSSNSHLLQSLNCRCSLHNIFLEQVVLCFSRLLNCKKTGIVHFDHTSSFRYRPDNSLVSSTYPQQRHKVHHNPVYNNTSLNFLAYCLQNTKVDTVSHTTLITPAEIAYRAAVIFSPVSTGRGGVLVSQSMAIF